MFTVNAIKIGKCIACGKETECFEVEARNQMLSGLLCIPDFKRQVKIVSANAPTTSAAISATASS